MTGDQWAERGGWALYLKGRISPWVRTKACHVDWGKAEERTVNSDCAFLIVWTLWKEGFLLVHWGLPCALISAHGQYSSSPTFSSAGSRDIYRSIAQGKVMDVQRCWVPSAASQNNQLNWYESFGKRIGIIKENTCRAGESSGSTDQVYSGELTRCSNMCNQQCSLQHCFLCWNNPNSPQK